MQHYSDVQEWIHDQLPEIAQQRLEDAKRLGTEAEAAAVERVERLLAEVEPGRPELSTLGSIISQVALSYVGVSERGTTNTGYLVNIWHKEVGLNPGLPWCVIFAQHVFRLVSTAYDMEDILPYNTASTQKLADWAEESGLATIDTRQADPGSLIIFRDGSKYQGHVEIITRANPMYYDSVGGNTNSEFSRDGGDVGVHEGRRWSLFGPVGSMTSDRKRWTRCIIPLSRLYNKYWIA